LRRLTVTRVGWSPLSEVAWRAPRGQKVNGVTVAGVARLKQVFKVTYPNGKVYVGSDLTGSISYFGSPGDKAKARIAADLGAQGCREFAVTKTILWECETATKAETLAVEREWIIRLGANDPDLGYNGSPSIRPT